MNKPASVGTAVQFGALPTYVGYQVRQMQAALFRDFRRITAETGLTPGEFGLLAMVRENPEINQVSLATLYRIDKSTLSLTIKALIRRGLIARARARADRRYLALSLTPAGKKALDQTIRQVEEQERRIDSALRPGERERLLDMLARTTAVFR